jgi:surface antigen
VSDIQTPDTVYGPGAGHLHEQGIGGNPYPYGECTWYVWQYYHDTQQVQIHGQLGNATDWVNSAHREQWPVDDTPQVAKTVCWSASKYPEFGHVGVCVQVNQDGSFDVLEMNFTFFADANPQLAGKIDRRTVKSRDGILGFITPTGVTASQGGVNDSGPLAALTAPLTGIGDAIRTAGLYLEAQALSAELQAKSMAEVLLGTTIAAGGLGLGAFTLAGRGSPSRGLARVRGRVTRQARRARGTVQPAPSSPTRRSLRTSEQAWVGRRTREEMVGAAARQKLARGVNPSALTDAEAAWLGQHPEATAAAFRGGA